MATPVSLRCAFCESGFARSASYVASQVRVGSRVRYCSQLCAWKGRAKEGRVAGKCRQCQAEFINWKSQIGKIKTERKYCSKLCMDTYRRSLRPVVKCLKCGAELRVAPSAVKRGRKYCSAECAEVAKTEFFRDCLECNTSFKYVPSAAKSAKYCSFICKVRFEGRARRKGFDYKDSLVRCSRLAWRQRRAAVLKRDGYCCTRCGVAAEHLDAHHKIPWKISKNDEMDNLVTLCRSCHMIVEPRVIPLRAGAYLPWGGVPSRA